MKKMIFAILTAAALILIPTTCFAAQWGYEYDRWYWENDDGSRIVDQWAWLDDDGDGMSESYHFNRRGYLDISTFVDGYEVNENGAWVQDGLVQTMITDPERFSFTIPGYIQGKWYSVSAADLSTDRNGTLQRGAITLRISDNEVDFMSGGVHIPYQLLDRTELMRTVSPDMLYYAYAVFGNQVAYNFQVFMYSNDRSHLYQLQDKRGIRFER